MCVDPANCGGDCPECQGLPKARPVSRREGVWISKEKHEALVEIVFWAEKVVQGDGFAPPEEIERRKHELKQALDEFKASK